jgi:hypothetical protein
LPEPELKCLRLVGDRNPVFSHIFGILYNISGTLFYANPSKVPVGFKKCAKKEAQINFISELEDAPIYPYMSIRLTFVRYILPLMFVGLKKDILKSLFLT